MPLNSYRKKGKEYFELTLLYIDHSINYRDGWGQTSNEDLEPSGFEYSFDNNDCIIPSTVKGFGIFEDIDKCKSYATLYEYLSDLIKNIKTGIYAKAYNPYEDIEHWLPMLEELKDGCFNHLSIKKAA
ncbi:MAG: hypothetical protein NC191_09605 [Muribaculaceae bacterium]|nr:hypothetical protein [Muribaculaceae bacterium]